jgi:dihydropteroate synthase
LNCSGKTAKELSVKIIEGPDLDERPLTMLDHANYLGREFQKAEFALIGGHEYVQD